MKAIVGAAGGVEKVLKDVGEAGGAAGNNNNAGKLFAGSGAGARDGADDADVGKAVAAVNAVSGEQILKAIVEAAGGAKVGGAAANTAKNPIAAAIGTDGAGAAFANGGMQNKNDKIAAAIVLRGMAKGGKFSLATQGNAAHKAGVKSAAQSGTAKTVNALTSIIQKAAEEGLKKVADAVKGIAASGKKLFADAASDEDKIGDVGSAANKGAGGESGSVNGIADGMKAIVEAAGGAEKVVGAEANTANNPIAAAIGTNGDGAAFANGMQDKNDKIAAAIVLRGMAKGGKFSLAAQNDADHKAGVKSAAQSGTAKTVNALTSIIQKAAEEGLKKVADAVKGIAASGKLFADAAGDYGKIFRLFENHLDSFLEFRVLGSAKISFKAHEPILKIALDY
ncbi:variable large family protein [Borreliella burgdorferi]|uniref:variable large family protein n=1 Tax=Borreliella burgdorferi TaxID=139 RepID=UPI003AA99012